MKDERGNNMLKILLTGISCSCRTEFLPILEEWLKEQRLYYATVSETATLLLQAGENPKGTYFQENIFTKQHKREEWATSQHVDVVIFDRGFLDQQAYTTPSTFLEMGKKYRVFDSKEDMFKRYDLVLHFESNAYHKHVAEGRLETQEEAVKLEKVTKFFTSQHPNYHFINSRKRIEDEFDEAKNIIAGYLPEITLFY